MFDHSFHFEGGSRNPVILDVISYKQIKPRIWEIVFDGYWYLEPETFPVKRKMQYSPSPTLFVDVLERTTIHNDPIEGTEDEPTLFPTSRIKIVYRIINDLKTEQDREDSNNALKTLEKDEELRNTAHRIARELKEHEELLRSCETVDYSKVTDFMKDIN
jgi:hypothetical protein